VQQNLTKCGPKEQIVTILWPWGNQFA